MDVLESLLLETPDPVDHVISQVPAQAVPELVDQCVAKKVRSIHFFTAGFSETGDEGMAAVEQEMIKKLPMLISLDASQGA